MKSLTVSWQEQGALFATKADMSGLDYLRGLISGDIVRPPVAQVMGLRPVEVEAGLVRFEMDVLEPFTNHLGFLAGGAVATGLDSAMGCAVLSAIEPDLDIVTLDLSLDFLRPVGPSVPTLYIEGRVSYLGRNRGLATGTVADADGRVLATGKSNCLVRSKKGR
ncbi:MAG: PaaI family thioesterase [Actinomycetota bacterium]|nr:PaaI family thioesterase [Actinomycetota bacterium]